MEIYTRGFPGIMREAQLVITTTFISQTIRNFNSAKASHFFQTSAPTLKFNFSESCGRFLFLRQLVRKIYRPFVDSSILIFFTYICLKVLSKCFTIVISAMNKGLILQHQIIQFMHLQNEMKCNK